MMITKIQLAAMSRVDIPEKERKDFYLYIDEFQNFSTDSFANILSEARKYRLDLILAHQYIEQLSEKVKPAVFGNVGTMITFRVGAADAEELAKEFMPTFNEEDLVNLPKYEMYLKLMIDGIASSPFSAKGLPPIPEDEKTNQEDKVIRASREKYATPRVVVEERIMNWHESSMGGIVINASNTASVQPVSSNNASIVNNNVAPAAVKYEPQAGEGYKTNCALCGNVTFTPFQPDGVRPVFCKQCLSKKKEERKAEMDAKQGKTAVSTPVKQPVVSPVQAPVSQQSTITPAPKINPNQNQNQVPKKPAAYQNKPANNNAPRHDFSKTSYIVKPQPFRPSSMEAFEVPEKPVTTLSLNDLTKVQPLNFKGNPDLIKPKKIEEPEELEEDFSTAEDLNSEVLNNWPSGETWQEGEEISLNKQNFSKDSNE
jgi:CxxC-x17-CxxC domain-containing protein